jgi:CDP-diacylglycerol--glycerol-3-phosphate 3-phosphatidyltransferase
MEAIRNSSTVNWPNFLTVIRLFMALAVPWLIAADTLGMQLLGGIVFTLAAVTDFFDGQLARRYGWITTFGKIVDPIADKLLTLGTFTTLSVLGMFPFWILIPIVVREITITLLRFYFLYKGVAVQAVKSGKHKMSLQIASITLAYFNYIYSAHVQVSPGSRLIDGIGLAFDVVMYAVLLAALYQTVYSGYIFLHNNRRLLLPKRR